MPWSVVQTHQGSAAIAVVNLRRKGFEIYNPLVPKRVRRANGRVVEVQEQLFRNYIFCLYLDQWYDIRSTIGVAKLLSFGQDRPAEVSEQIINQLKEKENKEGLIELKKVKFVLGDEIEIKSGPFVYHKGIFEGQRDGDRVAVLLSLLGAKRRVLVREDELISV